MLKISKRFFFAGGGAGTAAGGGAGAAGGGAFLTAITIVKAICPTQHPYTRKATQYFGTKDFSICISMYFKNTIISNFLFFKKFPRFFFLFPQTHKQVRAGNYQ